MPHSQRSLLLCLTLWLAPFAPADPAAPVPFQKSAVGGRQFTGEFYDPAGPGPGLGVLLLGGSEGGEPGGGKLLVQQGHAVLALAYFKAPGLPAILESIPLEYFDRAIAWLEASPRVRPGGIVICGSSKGAELALLVASRHPDVIGVIAISPSSVVWQGLPKSFWPKPAAHSSWTVAGQPLPFVPYDYSHFFNPFDSRAIYKFYDRSLAQRDAVAQAAIPVEKIHGPVLILSGRDDGLWPSARMGDMICDRLRARGFGYKFEHISYEHAGHTLNENYPAGGTPEGNKAARLASRAKLAEFLQQAARAPAPAEAGSN